MKSLDLCYLVTMGLALIVVTSVDGEEDEEPPSLLSRVCQKCKCIIRCNGQLRNTSCPGVVLDSVNIMGGWPGCTTLDINDGLLSSFQARSLKLQNLGIKTLRNNTFRGQALLDTLNLQHNSIETIENGTFNAVTGLRSLDLTSNKLTKFPFSALTMLPNLTNLTLNYNRLTSLDYPTGGQELEQQQQHFITIHSLENLRLTHNKITRISVEFINMFPKLSTLKLHRNRLVCDCHMAWLRDFQKCMCVTSLGESCRQPRSTAGYNLLTYPLINCPTSGTSLANCSSARDCALTSKKPITTRKSPGFSGTWGSWGDSGSSKTEVTTTMRVLTTTTKTTVMATTPTLETTDSPHGVVCASASQVQCSSLPAALGIVLVLWTGLQQQWLAL